MDIIDVAEIYNNTGGPGLRDGKRPVSVGVVHKEREPSGNTAERKLADKLGAAVGNQRWDPSLFANAVVNLHPLEQTAIMENFLSCVAQWADQIQHSTIDARLERTVFDSVRIRECLETFGAWDY